MKEHFTVTEADVENLKKVIEQQARVPKGEAQQTFCGIWPQAKNALELLMTFIGAIPGVGVFAKVAIGIVIAAGDAASKAVCKS
jgi:hypothetical protein